MSAFDSLDDVLADDAPKHRPMPGTLRAAVRIVSKADPFFGNFLSGLIIEHSGAVWCAATNCVDTILFNYDRIETERAIWTPALLACVLVHEMKHILRNDGATLSKFKRADVGNVAADACINRDLLESGWLWPRVRWSDPLQGGLTGEDSAKQTAQGVAPTLYATKNKRTTTRHVYDHLMKSKPPKQPQGSGMGGDVDMDGYRKASRTAGGAKAVADKIRDMAQEAARKADESTAPDMPKPGDAGDAGEQADGTGGTGWSLDKSAAYRELQDMGVRVRSPITSAIRKAGAHVRGLMRSKSHRHSSLLAPSPLSADMGRLMPGRRRANTIRPGIAIDGSGSISDAQMQVQRAAAQQWAQSYAGRAGPLPCCFFSDNIVASGNIWQFKAGEKIQGLGGGTDFRPVIRWAIEKRVTHLVIFTDACGPWPNEAPRGMQIINVLPRAWLEHSRQAVPFRHERVELDVPA